MFLVTGSSICTQQKLWDRDTGRHVRCSFRKRHRDVNTAACISQELYKGNEEMMDSQLRYERRKLEEFREDQKKASSGHGRI